MFMTVIANNVMTAIQRLLLGVFCEVPAHVVERRNQRDRQRGAHRGDGEDAGEQIDPTGEPRIRLPRQVLRPLKDRAGYRVVARELGEAERDGQLSDRHDRPAPDEDAADRREAQVEQGEDARRRRDVAERDGKRAEESKAPLQLLLVAELREILLVAGDVHECPPRSLGEGLIARSPGLCQSLQAQKHHTRHDEQCAACPPERHALVKEDRSERRREEDAALADGCDRRGRRKLERREHTRVGGERATPAATARHPNSLRSAAEPRVATMKPAYGRAVKMLISSR
jgi:hypothetical protein